MNEQKEIWIKLCADVHDYGLFAEFAEFISENLNLSIPEMDRQFRIEWDL